MGSFDRSKPFRQVANVQATAREHAPKATPNKHPEAKPLSVASEVASAFQHNSENEMTRDRIAAAIAALIAYGCWMEPAKAADKGGDTSSPLSFLPIGEVAKAGSWSGVGFGAYGSWINADTDTSPISIGSTGYSAGLTVSASLQMGSVVVEGFGDYGWMFGDLHDIGAEREMALGGRLGFLVNQNTLIYGLGAKSWVETEGGTIDGWQYGGGVKVRFASTPTFLSFEYRHSDYDASSILPVDITSDSVRVGVTVQLGATK